MTLLQLITSQIFAINPEVVHGYLPLIRAAISGEQVKAMREYNNKPYIVAANGLAYDSTANERGVMVVPVQGEITRHATYCGGRGTEQLAADIQRANDMPNVRGVVLRINTPGGMVSGTDIAAKAIRESVKPVVVHGSQMVASAGYWLASQADYIMSESPIDVWGSIGTMVSFWDYTEYYKQQGIELKTVYATASTDKNSDYHALMSGNYDDYRQKKLDPINDMFLQSVREGRKNISSDALTGKRYFASDAVGSNLQMIDAIGSLDDAIAKTIELSKNTKRYV